MNRESGESEPEVAEEANLSLNELETDPPALDEEDKSGDDHFPEEGEEPRLKYDRLSSDLKDILSRDSAAVVAVNEKFIVVGK